MKVRTEPSRTAAILRVEGLAIENESGEKVVRDVSFEVGSGKALALVGESGSGKTAVAHALLGFTRSGLRIAGGRVEVCGEAIVPADDRKIRDLRRSSIAYVPQDPASALNPRWTVKQTLRQVFQVTGNGTSASDIEAALERVGLPSDGDFQRRYPFEISGGQQQRILIACALAGSPRVVVLDEPTTGLDVTTQARIIALLVGLARDQDLAIVYVTHDLAVVDEVADRVVVMREGRVLERGSADDVLSRPQDDYTKKLLSSVPRLATGLDLGVTPGQGERGRSAGHVLAVEDLEIGYGKDSAPTVAEVSFEIQAGECLALVGESGSGKSTLGRAIAGLKEPRAGRINLKGEILAPTVERRSAAEQKAIQLIYQNPERALNPSYSVGGYLSRVQTWFYGSDRAACQQAVEEVLDRVHLPQSRLGRMPFELSGGEKQRVAIAAALLSQPEVIVCDEITSALDVSIQASILRLLSELKRDGLTTLFITHDLGVVRTIADRMIVLDSGRICESGDVVSVLESPTQQYTRELIAAVPSGDSLYTEG